jgi:CubicO group peptidase (beta-lactamase class C family)
MKPCKSPAPHRIGIALTVLMTACTSAPPRPEAVARGDYDAVIGHARNLVRHEMTAASVTGLSIALIDDQRLVWAEGFGHADKEGGRPATAETLYRVGSISKLLTATAAMQLAEQGKLDIDRPLRDALPEFSVRSRFAGGAPITPRMLMTHHSGLPRDFTKGMFTRNPEPFTQLIQKVRTSDAAYPPNQVFSYSNVGVTLLGHAIQNASGMPFAEYMQQSVLAPLGMAGASFEPGPARSELMSKAYRKGEPAEELPLRDVPAGGLNASVLDLGRFLAMVFADGRAHGVQVLTPDSVREMLRPQNTDVPLDLNFHNGLGWMLSTLGASTLEKAGPVAHHAGAMLHFRAQMYALPEHKLGVVVLANSASAGPVIDKIATETLGLALEAKAGIRQPARVPPAKQAWPEEKLSPYVGDYTSPFGHIRIRFEGDRLRADALGRTFNLIPRSDEQLGVEYKLLGLLNIDLGALDAIGFTRRRVAGREVLVARAGAQEMLIGERIQPAQDLSAWLLRLGRYEIANAGDDHTFVERITLLEERGFLMAELKLTDQPGPPQRLVLQPLSEHAAIVLGPLADGGGMLRCAADGEREQCSISGYTLKRLAH